MTTTQLFYAITGVFIGVFGLGLGIFAMLLRKRVDTRIAHINEQLERLTRKL
jgi:hypothetical protein